MMIYPLSAEIQGFYPTFGPTTVMNNGTLFIFVLPREAVGNCTGTTASFTIKFNGGHYTMTYVRSTNMVHAEYSNPPSAAATAYNNWQDRNFVVMVEMSGDGSTNARLTTHVNGELKAVNTGHHFGWSEYVWPTSLYPGFGAAVGWHQLMVLVFDEEERLSGRPRALAEELRNAEFWRYNIVAQEVMSRPVVLPTPVQPPPQQQPPRPQQQPQQQPPRAAPKPAPAPQAPRPRGDDD